MRKTGLSILLLIIFQTVIFAQAIEIEGVWKMYEAEMAGEKQEISVPMTFSNDGNILLAGRVKGSWALNQTENTLTIQTDLLMNLEGECAIAFKNEELLLTNPEKETSKLRRLSVLKDHEYTNEIAGSWELKEIDGVATEEGRTIIVDYNKNGVFYQRGIILGTWKYDKKANTIMQKAERSDVEELNGEASIVQLDPEHLIYELNGAKNSFQRVAD